MKKSILSMALRSAAMVMLIESQAWALGGGRLAATQAMTGMAGEFSGPLAYATSLIAITGSAISWYRHHHDMGALSSGGLGVLFVGGVALGAGSLMGFIPGVAGATI